MIEEPRDPQAARNRTATTLAAALIAAALSAGGAQAQQPGPVTLVFDNGLDGENLTGTLRDYDGARFMLDTSIGPVAIPAEGVSCIGAACPEGTVLELDSPVLRLTSLDGTSTVSGKLMAFQDGAYLLATDVGEIAIAADKVTCEGAGCVATAASFGGPATLHGGGMSIEGTLVAVEDDIWVLDVVGFGELRVPVADYTCEGPGCP